MFSKFLILSLTIIFLFGEGNCFTLQEVDDYLEIKSLVINAANSYPISPFSLISDVSPSAISRNSFENQNEEECQQLLLIKLVKYISNPCINKFNENNNVKLNFSNIALVKQQLDLICPCSGVVVQFFQDFVNVVKAPACVAANFSSANSFEILIETMKAVFDYMCVKREMDGKYCIIVAYNMKDYADSYDYSNGALFPGSIGCIALNTLGCCAGSMVKNLNKLQGSLLNTTEKSTIETAIDNCGIDKKPCVELGEKRLYIIGRLIIRGLNIQYPNSNDLAKARFIFAARRFIAIQSGIDNSTITISKFGAAAGGGIEIEFRVASTNDTKTETLYTSIEEISCPSCTPQMSDTSMFTTLPDESGVSAVESNQQIEAVGVSVQQVVITNQPSSAFKINFFGWIILNILILFGILSLEQL